MHIYIYRERENWQTGNTKYLMKFQLIIAKIIAGLIRIIKIH